MRMLKARKDSFSLKKSGEGKVVFITGGGGRVGRYLSRALVRKGYTVRALSHDRNFVHTMPAGVIPYVGDLGDKKLMGEACHGVDTVFHLAAIVSQYKSTAKKLMEVNVKGTANMLDACRQNAVEHLVFTSSIDVYGRTRSEALEETSELRPSDKYGYSKMLAEQEIVQYGDKIDYTILRMAAIYGPGFEQSYFKLFKALKDGKAYIIGDGKNHLAIVHIEDVVSALILAAENKKSSKNIYNLGDGVKYTQSELINIAADMLKVSRPARHISPMVVNLVAKSRGLDSDELRFLMSDRVVNIGKIRKELGFKPSMEIHDAGMDMVGDFLSRG